jgi:hypothetical protein
MNAGCVGHPAVIAEIAMCRPGRQHRNISGNITVAHFHMFGRTIDAGDLAQQQACVGTGHPCR